MSSACINPFLYGYLNETFRKEFKEIAGPFKSCVESKLPTCLRSKLCCTTKEEIKIQEQERNSNPIELQPLEIKVQNSNGKSPKVENKLIPREATSLSIEKKSIELITVHNGAKS